MVWIQNLPIKRKLTLVILLTCATALLLACGVLALYQTFDFRRAMVRDTTVLADVLAKNTRAAFAFQDETAARETLQALQSEPSIVAARLYTKEGGKFADYVRTEELFQFPARPENDTYRFEQGRLVLFRPVVLNDKSIGNICLVADLQGMHERFLLFGSIAAAVLLASILIAFVLSSHLQQFISKPILALAETARTVAEQKDFAVRAARQGRDETGRLTDAFNEMLDGIQKREWALRAEIAERKLVEDKVQAQLGRLELLSQITRAIGERQDLPSIFQVVVRTLEDQLPVDFGCVCLYDQASHKLVVMSIGARDETLAAELAMAEQAQLDIDENGLSRCVQGELVYESDLKEIQFPFARRLAGAGLRSVVLAPLLVESKVFGVLVAGRKQPESFSSSECEFIRQLSGHVALAAHQTQLYVALQQAYEDLRQTQQAVMQQERLRALGQMASGIAHDINNAISPVALYTESLLENEPNLSPRARDYLQTIEHAIDDVTATVARMREFYRQREPQLTLVPVRLNQLIQQVVNLTRARWSDMPQQKGIMIEMRTELSPELPAVRGVESEIREALTNLIFNAVDAMPEGGTLTLRTRVAEKTPVSPDAQVLRYALLEVTDTGLGMDEDTRRRCLEPFFTTKGERGTGLGLAMVYGIVQRHNAEIEIESAAGKGTTIRLSFSVPETSLGDPARPELPAPVLSRLRILLVDDDPLLLKSLRDALETDGHVVVAANGGQVGIDTFQLAQKGETPFAVVITDLGMPYVDGRKVAAAVKKTSPTTPVIMLTGWGQRLIVQGDIPAHVDQVLSKPPKMKDVRAALVRCLQPAQATHLK